MADDMLIWFDSPLNKVKSESKVVGLKSPLIPCPKMPFDIVEETTALELDPFERVLKTATCQTPGRARAVSSPCSPSETMRELPQDSVLDLSAALSARCLISSTPNTTGITRKDQQLTKMINSAPGTPTRHQRSGVNLGCTPRRTVIESQDLEKTIMQKLKALQALNQLLPSVGRSNLRRSLSTSDLPQGLRQQTVPGAMETFSSSRDGGMNNLTFNKHNMSIINESFGDATLKDVNTTINTNTLKKEALKLSSLFNNYKPVDLDESDDILATPIYETTKRRYSKTIAGKGSSEDIRNEIPPWEWSGSSSEDEDGLPKIVRLRVSFKNDDVQSPDTISLVNRYKKKRESLKIEDEKQPEVQPSTSESQPVVEEVPEPVPTTLVNTTVPPIIKPPPMPESELRPKSATTNVVKKGPLKAMMPLPRMVKPVTQTGGRASSAGTIKTPDVSLIQGPRGREQSKMLPFKRTNSSSAILTRHSNPVKQSTPKQMITKNKVIEKRSSASPTQGVLETVSSKLQNVNRKGPSLLKKRSSSASGKENLLRK